MEKNHGSARKNHGSFEEDDDLFRRSKRRNKEENDGITIKYEIGDSAVKAGETKEKRSYMGTILGAR